MIYLDNSATTHPRQEVLQSFQKAADLYYANPSSIHRLGSKSERLLEQSRNQAAEWLGVGPHEILFTSGGTEGNNLAIKGVAFKHQSRGKHMITSSIEHPSVLETFKALETLGFEVTYVPVDHYGKVDPEDVKREIRKDTILVSIMSVNNELGTVQPITEIGQHLAEYPRIFFHVDHVQGLGKIPLSINDARVDLCTVSGHKIHGLKGTGILIKRNHVSLFPLLHGGGQELEIRSGTENLPGTVSLVKALRLLLEDQRNYRESLQEKRDFLWVKLKEIDGVVINSPEDGAPHIINVSVPGFKPEVMIHALGEKEIYISTKSACSSKAPDVSAVLQACHVEDERTTSALRVSLSALNTIDELERFIEEFTNVIKQLKTTMR